MGFFEEVGQAQYSKRKLCRQVLGVGIKTHEQVRLVPEMGGVGKRKSSEELKMGAGDIVP